MSYFLYQVCYYTPDTEVVVCSDFYCLEFLVCRNKQSVTVVLLESLKCELSVDETYGQAAVVRLYALVYDKQVTVIYPLVNH